MKFLRAAAAFALFAMPFGAVVGTSVGSFLASPAHAQQMPNINLIPEMQSKTQEEKDADAERDKAYKESLRKIPDAKASSDPWGTVRSDTPKSTAAPAKTTATAKKPKTTSSAN